MTFDPDHLETLFRDFAAANYELRVAEEAQETAKDNASAARDRFDDAKHKLLSYAHACGMAEGLTL